MISYREYPRRNDYFSDIDNVICDCKQSNMRERTLVFN